MPGAVRGSSSGNAVTVNVNDQEFKRLTDTIKKMERSLDITWMKRTHARNLRPIRSAMIANSKSSRIAAMIGITTALKKTPPYGAKVGVINNSKALFPKFSAPATASVIEYGTDERFRVSKKFAGVAVGAASTGKMKPAPFLRPAWDMGAPEYIRKTEKDIVDKVQKDGA